MNIISPLILTLVVSSSISLAKIYKTNVLVDLDEKYNEGAALFLLGDCYRLTGETEAALECFNKVVEYYPNNKWGRQAKVYIAADDTELSAAEIGD